MSDLAELKDLTEIRDMLSERVTEWTKEWQEEGFRKGLVEGMAEGIVKGLVVGEKKAKLETVRNMLHEEIADDVIARATGLMQERITQLKEKE